MRFELRRKSRLTLERPFARSEVQSARTTFVFSALLSMCVLATSAASAQTSKPIVTDYPPYLCVGGGFVAMAGISARDPLVVVLIDFNGIEAPQTIPSVGDAVLGMQCSGSHIELLVLDYKSGRLIMPLCTVQWHSQSATTIHEEQSEDPAKFLPTA